MLQFCLSLQVSNSLSLLGDAAAMSVDVFSVRLTVSNCFFNFQTMILLKKFMFL